MKCKIMITTALISVAASTLSYAFYCPTNFNDIQIGDSFATVEKKCGPPATKDIKDAPDNQPQEWSYFLSPQDSYQVPTKAQGTLKTTIAFDGNQKVINISVNNIGVASFRNCGRPISLGETRDTVEAACGKPTLISKANQGAPAPAPNAPVDLTKKQVEYIYNSTPPITLIFLNGVLAEKR